MAIARLSVGTGGKGKASCHSQYIAREGKYQKPSTHAEKLENTGYGNMPQWAENNPNFFWQCADEHERKNGSTYREHVIALPRELSEQQRHNLVKDWIKSEIGDKHAYQYAIHNPPAMDGREQPHCHLMFSERTRDGIERDPDQYFKRYNSKNPERGGAKKANTGLSHAERKADLIAQRDRWEKLCNQHLERAGRYERISMKSLKERGINRKPLNIPMHQMNKPQVKEAYKAMLEAKNEAIEAYFRSWREVRPNQELKRQQELERQRRQELERQRRQELERQRQQELEERQRQQELEERQRQQELEERQRQQELERLSDVTPFELIGIRVKATVSGFYSHLSGDYPIGSGLYSLITQVDNNSIRLVESNNQHLANNPTAQNIKKFILSPKSLRSHDVVSDYGSMGVAKFVRKYRIEHDLNDLRGLYTSRIDKTPQQTNESVPEPTPKPKNGDNGLDFDY